MEGLHLASSSSSPLSCRSRDESVTRLTPPPHLPTSQPQNGQRLFLYTAVQFNTEERGLFVHACMCYTELRSWTVSTEVTRLKVVTHL